MRSTLVPDRPFLFLATALSFAAIQVNASAQQYEPSPYHGQLAPLDNISARLAGKTIYLQQQVARDGQIIAVKSNSIYLAPQGKAYSASFSVNDWTASGDELCLISSKPNCVKVLVDQKGWYYIRENNGLTMKIVRTSKGDPDHLETAFAAAQSQKQAEDRKIYEAGMDDLSHVTVQSFLRDSQIKDACDAACMSQMNANIEDQRQLREMTAPP